MPQVFANNAYSVLNGAITNVATSLVVTSGTGSRFPAPSGGDYFLLTLIGYDVSGVENAWEIVKCTARSADTLTIVRAQEGTSATSWISGTRVELRATAEALTTVHAHAASTSNPHGVTKVQVGLSNVDNTADAAKPVSTAQQTALDLKVNISSIVNNLTSVATNVPLSAAQGKTLKDMIDAINTLLASDETTLDSLQEVVDYIMANRNTLESLGIANISGLQAALDGKSSTSHNHSGVYQPLATVLTNTTASFMTAQETKLGYITVTQPVDLDQIESDTVTNNAKVSNATHTGDVTGSTALTIANNAVTLAKMADMATASLIGRNTASTGDPEVLSASTVRSMLSINNVDNTSDATKNSAVATLQNKTLEGAAITKGTTEDWYAIPSSTTPALSTANGSKQTWTLTGNSTPTIGTLSAGQHLLLAIDDGSAYTINWGSVSVTWKTDSGSAPTLNTTGYTFVLLEKIGSTIYGWRCGNA